MMSQLRTFEYICDCCKKRETIQSRNKYGELPPNWKIKHIGSGPDHVGGTYHYCPDTKCDYDPIA